jgi:hypothetical protein
LDGTLIQYPKNDKECVQINDGRGEIASPPSKTGMVGCISSQTFTLCNKIQKQKTKQIVLSNGNEKDEKEAVRLVFDSGMRSSTLISCIAYLPKADVYCCDSGRRIFYSCILGICNIITTSWYRFRFGRILSMLLYQLQTKTTRNEQRQYRLV